MLSILIEWLRKPRVRKWNDTFPAKQKWMTMTFCEKKVTASSVEQKQNRSGNLKHHYVAFQFPSNRIKNIAPRSFYMKISHSYIVWLLLLFQSQTRTLKNCLTCNFSLQNQYIFQSTVLENKATCQHNGIGLTQYFIL